MPLLLRRRARMAGLTLTEVVVSFGLAGLVSAAAVSLSGVYATSVGVHFGTADADRNMWAAQEFIARDLRKAGSGFGMGQGGRFQRWMTGNALQFPTATFKYSTPPFHVQDGGSTGTDVLNIFYGTDPSLAPDTVITADVNKSTPTVLSVSSSAGIIVGDYVVAWNNAGLGNLCAVFRVSGVTPTTLSIANTSVAANPIGCPGTSLSGPSCENEIASTFFQGLANPLPATTATVTGGAVMRIGQLRRIRYRIQFEAGKPPVLMRDAYDGPGSVSNEQVVAVGIDDLQIAYACDANGGGIAQYRDERAVPASALHLDEWYPNDPFDPVLGCYLTPDSPRPRYVRVSLGARTKTKSGGGMFQPRPRLENHLPPPTGTMSDYRYRVISTVVALRNI